MYSGLPNGGNSLTTPQASASAAAYARKRLQAAQAQGLLPQNFNIAKTNDNLIGQFHMLNPGIAHAGHNGGATADNQSAIMQLIGQLGGNNLVSRGQQAQYGPQGQLPNGGNSAPTVGDLTGGGDPQTQLMMSLWAQLMGQAGQQGFNQAQPFYNPAQPTLY